MNMPKIALWYALILILMGLVGYFGMGRESITALIPTFVGIPVLVAALLARNDSIRKHAMHAAVLLAVLAFAGTVMGIPKAITMLTGGDVARPKAVTVQAIMALLSLVFVALAVKSFIDARRSPAVSGN